MSRNWENSSSMLWSYYFMLKSINVPLCYFCENLNLFTFKLGREIQMTKDLWIPQSKIMQCLQDGVHFIIPFNDTAGKKSKQYLVTLWPMINNIIRKFGCLFLETKCKMSRTLWHFRLWSFQGRDSKLERFLAKNQLYSNEIAKFWELE